MKKSTAFLILALCVAGLGLTLHSAVIQAEAAQGIMCPKCNIEIASADKPVLSMLAGKQHTCPSCGKTYNVASNQEVHVCSACGGQIETCPACGKTELIPKA